MFVRSYSFLKTKKTVKDALYLRKANAATTLEHFHNDLSDENIPRH